jgi:CrcB protein
MTRQLLYRNLIVFVGSGLGGVARFAVGAIASSHLGGPFPWGTFLINVTGCFVMGSLMYLFKDRPVLSPHHRLFFMVGVLGGYTTFSSFGYECDLLGRTDHPLVELGYVLLSVILGLGAVWAGRATTHGLYRALGEGPAGEAAEGSPSGARGALDRGALGKEARE